MLWHTWLLGKFLAVNNLNYYFIIIYCHLYSAFSIVQCSNVLYRLWDGEIQRHTGQPSVREIDAHTMYNQWATAPGRSLNYPRTKSITHLRTFSDNGVYLALQLFLVILVSDQWRRVLILIDRRPGVFYMLGDDSPDKHGTNGFTWFPTTGDILSNVESQVFTLYNFGSSRDRTPDLLTTRPT